MPHRTGRRLQALADAVAGRRAPTWAVTVDDDDTEVLTVKPADRGDGVIVRLRSWGASDDEVRRVGVGFDASVGAVVTRAWRCDSNERDVAPLAVVDGGAIVDVDRLLTSVRLVT
jgi:hypothetical protein